MVKNNYDVTIIIPIYNGENFLEVGLNSIFKQTYDINKIEVLMIDDMSKDNSFKIMKKFEKMNKNFKPISMDEQSGHASLPRNKGIKIAQGEYIMFMDQDDSLELDAVANLVNGIAKNNADICIGFYQTKYGTPYKNIKKDVFYNSINDNFKLLSASPMIWDKIFKKDIILNNKIEFPGYLLAEDLYFATAYISCCQGIQLIDSVVYNYNVRDGEEKSVSLTLTLDFYQRMVNGFLYIEDYLLKTNKKELISPTLSSHVLYYLITINYSKDIPKSERQKLFKELERLMIYFDSKWIYNKKWLWAGNLAQHKHYKLAKITFKITTSRVVNIINSLFKRIVKN